MGQFCVYINPNPATRVQYPYLLDIQSALLSELRTTVVIPLTPSKLAAPMRMTRLNPTIDIDGKSFTVMTQEIAGIDRNQLGAQTYNLSSYRSEIIAALDFILSGI